jgi:hypothetical protein
MLEGGYNLRKLGCQRPWWEGSGRETCLFIDDRVGLEPFEFFSTLFPLGLELRYSLEAALSKDKCMATERISPHAACE